LLRASLFPQRKPPEPEPPGNSKITPVRRPRPRLSRRTHACWSISERTLDQARIARDAYRDFGKGSGHKASLNFGDCFAYALATSAGEALLFKGDDFGHTDITPALLTNRDVT
jgi:uncharacterized protein with PIN domain